VARQSFFAGDAPVGISSALISSWTRCTTLGFRPNDKIALVCHDQSKFKTLTHTNATLLKAATGEIEAAARTLGGLEYGIMLTDTNGAVLDCHVNRAPYLHKFMRPGLDLSEMRVGTSAMALAVDTGVGADVMGDAHFFDIIQHLLCQSQPVFDPQGQLAGVLTVTATKPMPRQIVRHVLTRTAQAINTNLVRSQSDFFLRFSYGHHDSAASGALAFGADGEVVGANRLAYDMLGLDHVRGGATFFSDLFDASFSDVMSGQGKGQKLISAQPRSAPYFILREVSRRSQIHISAATAAPPVWMGDRHFEACLSDAVVSLEHQRPVLLEGPSGSGKTHAARWLHSQTRRAEDAFVVINCAAARHVNVGDHIRSAQLEHPIGAVLFRNIEQMQAENQAQLVDILERRPDLSILCSTGKPLETSVQSELCDALYFLLRPERVPVPALVKRDQKQVILDSLIVKIMPDRKLTLAAKNALHAYHWPGNFREVHACFERLAALCPKGAPVCLSHIKPMFEIIATAQAPEYFEVSQAKAIEQALAYCKGNRSAAARRLGISRATLHRRLKGADKPSD
jgi:transcriptional regulator of acetoin/glycerol metabolism